MVISSKFCMAQYRDDDRREDALQFIENGHEHANGNMKMGILKCFKQHYKKIILVFCIGFSAIFTAVVMIRFWTYGADCESEGCNNGCLMVPLRTYCQRGTDTDCFNNTKMYCIDEDDWTDYAGRNYKHVGGR